MAWGVATCDKCLPFVKNHGRYNSIGYRQLIEDIILPLLQERTDFIFQHDNVTEVNVFNAGMKKTMFIMCFGLQIVQTLT